MQSIKQPQQVNKKVRPLKSKKELIVTYKNNFPRPSKTIKPIMTNKRNRMNNLALACKKQSKLLKQVSLIGGNNINEISDMPSRFIVSIIIRLVRLNTVTSISRLEKSIKINWLSNLQIHKCNLMTLVAVKLKSIRIPEEIL